MFNLGTLKGYRTEKFNDLFDVAYFDTSKESNLKYYYKTN
jgi:hypothetical protein